MRIVDILEEQAEETLDGIEDTAEWRETWDELNQALWLAARLEDGEREYPVTLRLPHDTPLAMIGEAWRWTPTGMLEGTFQTQEELAWALVAAGLDSPAIDLVLMNERLRGA